MRKNIKNDKVIKAITIGLASMIAVTSSPVSVLAEDEAQAEPAAQTSNESQSENTNNTNESSAAAQTAGTCTEVANTEVPAAVEAVSEASAAVEAIPGVVDLADQTVVDGIGTGLAEVSADITALGSNDGDLANASELIGEALVADLKADTAVTAAEGQLTEAAAQQAVFAQADTKTEDNSSSAVDKAEVANTSSSKVEAYQAKDDAEAALSAAKDGLAAATEAYDKTSEAVSKAEREYNTAVDEQKATADRLAEAKEALKKADTNATAANERMKALQSQMDNLNSKVEDLANQKEDLEKLNEQYYKLMVHFYRDDKIKCAVYNSDGTLNIEKSAEKAKGKNTAAANENTFKVGRALMAELIEFKLKAAGVDPSTIHIGEQVAGGTAKKMSEGELTKDNSGNDRVVMSSEEDIWFANYGKGNDGRGNAVKVTYTVTENGEEKTVTEYYNYVLKSKEGEKDLENGPIYLAKIDINATGEDMISRDTDENNMDDLRNLNARIAKAMKAAQILDEYAAAKKEVDEAAKLVDELTEAIDKLNKTDIRISAEKVENLGKALLQAKKDLKDASDRKDELEGMVADAQAAVDGIDLSRFNESLEETGTDSAERTTTAPSAVIYTDLSAEEAPMALSGSESTEAATANGTSAGVLGVRTGGAAEAEGEGQEDEKSVLKTDFDAEEIELEEAKGNEDTGKVVMIGDSKVPLADLPSEADENISWWWLLIIALGATGKAMYENYKNRKEESQVK